MDGLKARLSFDAVAYDYDDEYLTIDTDTHTININNVSRLFGVQYDGNSKLIKFRVRNKLSDIQKMQDSIVYINWIDSRGVKGQSIAINKTINNDTCEFAWKVPFDALKNSGVLHFAMSAVMTKNSSSVIDQRWSTQIASVITPDGIYIKSYTPSSEEEDRIAQIYNELSNMINKLNDNLQSQVNSLNEALAAYEDYTFSNYKQDNLLKYATWELGKYVQASNGTLDANAEYSASDYIEINPKLEYICEVAGSPTWLYALYDANKTYISGDTTQTTKYIYPPTNAKYIRISMQTIYKDTNSFHPKEITQILNKNIKVYGDSIITRENVITVSKDGSKNFTSIRQALDSIKDSSKANQYTVKFYGDGTYYDIRNEFSSSELLTNNGLTIPPYTTLEGVGGTNLCILSCSLSEQESNRNFSIINLNSSSNIKNFRLIGTRTRNVIHSDFGVSNSESTVEDCILEGHNLNLYYVLASGLQNSCKQTYKNCVFHNYDEDYVFSCHNGQNFTNNGYLSFDNCRFIGASKSIVRLGSITTNANNMQCLCEMRGCKETELILDEESVGVYGAGILWKVMGYGNVIADTKIENTDGKDYSSNIDLI